MASSTPAGGIYLPGLRHPVHRFGARIFDFSCQVALMAIINRTPDSFYDGGRTFELGPAIGAALQAVKDGADWVDIGGVAFAPGVPVSIAEEIDRVVPVIDGIRARCHVVISVESFRPEVARSSITAGATIINDTTGLRNPDLATAVADSDAHL